MLSLGRFEIEANQLKVEAITPQGVLGDAQYSVAKFRVFQRILNQWLKLRPNLGGLRENPGPKLKQFGRGRLDGDSWCVHLDFTHDVPQSG